MKQFWMVGVLLLGQGTGGWAKTSLQQKETTQSASADFGVGLQTSPVLTPAFGMRPRWELLAEQPKWKLSLGSDVTWTMASWLPRNADLQASLDAKPLFAWSVGLDHQLKWTQNPILPFLPSLGRLQNQSSLHTLWDPFQQDKTLSIEMAALLDVQNWFLTSYAKGMDSMGYYGKAGVNHQVFGSYRFSFNVQSGWFQTRDQQDGGQYTIPVWVYGALANRMEQPFDWQAAIGYADTYHKAPVYNGLSSANWNLPGNLVWERLVGNLQWTISPTSTSKVQLAAKREMQPVAWFLDSYSNAIVASYFHKLPHNLSFYIQLEPSLIEYGKPYTQGAFFRLDPNIQARKDILMRTYTEIVYDLSSHWSLVVTNATDSRISNALLDTRQPSWFYANPERTWNHVFFQHETLLHVRWQI